MYYVVTGAAGFIGSNLVKALNERGLTNIIGVDNLTRAEKSANLADCVLADYLDKDEFIDLVSRDAFENQVAAVLHQGACSDTQQTDGRYMMENNHRYSVRLLEYCQRHRVPLIYASSAAVYGANRVNREEAEFERPLNVYGYSKLTFDQFVRQRVAQLSAPVVGLRYFNVYGPRETHKQGMASVVLHFVKQLHEEGRVKLFEGSHGFAHGEQRRDFVALDDVVNVNLHFLQQPSTFGIYNVGSGTSRSFNDIAMVTINAYRRIEGAAPRTFTQLHEQGVIQYVPFPPPLLTKYQSFTQADLGALRQAGYAKTMLSIDDGVGRYVSWLRSQHQSPG